VARKKPVATDTVRISPAESGVIDQSNLFPLDRTGPVTAPSPEPTENEFDMPTDGAGGPTAVMPPADLDDFFSPENLRIAQEFAPPPDSATFAVDVRKPPKDQYIMAHPDPNYSMVWPIIEMDETVYVVHPVLAKTLQSDPTVASSIKAARIVLCAIHRGPLFVWVVKQPADPTKKSAMHVALDQCLGFAMAGWTRITWSEEKRQHEAFTLKMENPPTPAWPAKSFPEILKTAFGDARMIKTADHPVIRKLSGLEL
jgi:hypothetical protein